MSIFKPSHGIAFDIDGTTLNSPQAIWDALMERVGLAWSIDRWTSYDIEEVLGIPIEEARNVYDPCLSRLDVPLYPGAAEVLRWLVDETGEPILFITARRPLFKDYAAECIRRELGRVPFEVVSTTDPDACTGQCKDDKAGMLINHGVSMYIEDNYKYWSEYLSSGICVGTLRQPWNTNALAELVHPNLVEFDDWYELGDYIKRILDGYKDRRQIYS